MRSTLTWIFIALAIGFAVGVGYGYLLDNAPLW